tara:strand:+ start:41 stop:358 length:318 start_codon:yes stop_codon:yes gene_type:complete
MNPFDKLWFADIKNAFIEKDYEINYNMTQFVAKKRSDKSTRFMVTLKKSETEVVIPFQRNYEYKTTFTECYKVVDYLLYHLNDNTLLNSYEIINESPSPPKPIRL